MFFDPLHGGSINDTENNLAFYDSYLIMYYILYIGYYFYENIFIHFVVGNHDINYGYSNLIFLYLLVNSSNIKNKEEKTFLIFV